MSGKGVGDPDGSWAHYMYATYPRRAENQLPPAARERLERERQASSSTRSDKGDDRCQKQP
jgi:hypothetical protein